MICELSTNDLTLERQRSRCTSPTIARREWAKSAFGTMGARPLCGSRWRSLFRLAHDDSRSRAMDTVPCLTQRPQWDFVIGFGLTQKWGRSKRFLKPGQKTEVKVSVERLSVGNAMRAGAMADH